MYQFDGDAIFAIEATQNGFCRICLQAGISVKEGVNTAFLRIGREGKAITT